MKLAIDGQEYEVDPRGDSIVVNGEPYAVRVRRQGEIFTVYVNERPFAVQLEQAQTEGLAKLIVDAKVYQVEMKGGLAPARPARRAPPSQGPALAPAGRGAITASMTGRVIRVNVHPGDDVQQGDILLVIEAMKMENEVTAPQAGKIKEVAVALGARVTEGDLLLVLEEA